MNINIPVTIPESEVARIQSETGWTRSKTEREIRTQVRLYQYNLEYRVLRVYTAQPFAGSAGGLRVSWAVA